MRSDREHGGPVAEVMSLRDLQQIRDAVSELRALNPRSALADLVEERIRMTVAGDPQLQFDVAPLRRRCPAPPIPEYLKASTFTDAVHTTDIIGGRDLNEPCGEH